MIRRHDQRRGTGGHAAKAQGGDTWSPRIEAHRDTILALHEGHRDITLAQKKTGHAAEQDRADVLSAREAWFVGQLDLDPERLVFIDETWTATNMTRSHGRCRRGERLRMGYPHRHRKTTTLVAGRRMIGMVAPMVLDGPINGDWFEACVGQVLVPELEPGDVVVMDNERLWRSVNTRRSTCGPIARSARPAPRSAGI